MGAYVIAEIGVNHNGDEGIARNLIEIAAKAGANAVKFQTFQPILLTQNESERELLAPLSLSLPQFKRLKAYSEHCGIEFLSSPFDLVSLAWLTQDLKLPRIKIASGELTNAPLLFAAAKANVAIILSTGMSTLGEIEQALGILAYGYLGGETPTKEACAQAYVSYEGQSLLRHKVVLLHCTSAYPAVAKDINLAAIQTMRSCFDLPLGYSDHSLGTAVAIAAIAMGAVVLEKHMTGSKTWVGPDHHCSLEPDELRAMIRDIRTIEDALGSKLKCPSDSEWSTRIKSRKSLYITQPLQAGDMVTAAHLTAKRPDNGLSAIHYWDVVGKVATKDYAANQLYEG